MKTLKNQKETENTKSNEKRSEQYGCMYCEKLILIYKDDLCENCYKWYEGIKPYCT